MKQNGGFSMLFYIEKEAPFVLEFWIGKLLVPKAFQKS